MKKLYKLIGLIIVLSLIVVGCSTEDTGEKENPENQEEQVTETEEKVEKETEKDSVDEEESKEDLDKEEQEIYSSRLVDLMKSDRYTLKMNSIVNVEGEEMESLVTTVVADGQSATIIESGDVSMTSIIKDDKSYMVMHDEKTVIVGSIPEEEELGLDEVDFENLEYLEKGKEEFLGNERVYEEYKVDDGRVRYYFDGKELDGMKIMFGEETSIIDVEFLSDQVDMSVFEIPKDYEKIEY